jgi:hypothetical protein
LLASGYNRKLGLNASLNGNDILSERATESRCISMVTIEIGL